MNNSRSLARLLDAPHLDRLVPQLRPEALRQLIRQDGLHATVELITLATPAQLAAVLDVDLWRHDRPGLDDRFDIDRFGEWIEVLVDAGEAVAARVVAALDEQLVVAGLSRYVRVFDPGIFEPIAQSDDEAAPRHRSMREGDSTRSSHVIHDVHADGRDPGAAWLECEVGGYIVRARRPDGWDAVVSLLAAFEVEFPDRFHTVMRGCQRLSNSTPEVDGLDNLLTEPDQMFHELAVDREGRRSRQGYSSPADARVFLEMARHTQRSQPRPNAIAAAYFRDANDTTAAEAVDGPARTAPDLQDAATLFAIVGVAPEHPPAVFLDARSDPSRFACIQPLLEYARDHGGTAFLQRTRELAFLANTLMAGCSLQSRPFTPQEASQAVVGICNLALEHWPARWSSVESSDSRAGGTGPMEIPPAFLMEHDLISAFEVGWTLLYQDVSLFVAQELIATLRNLRCVDDDVQEELDELRRQLVTHVRAGTPWRARPALGALATLDGPAWASLLGLLDECPVVPAALTATLDRRTTAVSPTAFEFFSTSAQIDQVRAFMAQLPRILHG
jgi:hypothetical protein